MQHPWSALPSVFLERLPLVVPQEKLASVLEALSQNRVLSFRINTLKADTKDVVKSLENNDFHPQRISWYADAFIIEDDKKEALLHTNFYKDGSIYLQSLSSMIPSLILDVEEEQSILDLCAAPGSKTAHIAALMRNTGSIIANDNSRKRLYKLETNLVHLGVTNTKWICLPGEWIWKKYPEQFDRVLVDVPCSMEGRFVATDPETFVDWSPKKAKLLRVKQQYLLRSAIGAVRVGGIVVYSTCTLSIEENEKVISWILEKEKSTVVLEDILLPDASLIGGITSWKGKALSKELSKTKRIIPSKAMEGFFVAKFRKIASTFPTTGQGTFYA